MDDIDELVEQLRAPSTTDDDVVRLFFKAANMIEQLQRELENDRQDAERYQWIAADQSRRAPWEFCDSKADMDKRIDAARQRPER